MSGNSNYERKLQQEFPKYAIPVGTFDDGDKEFFAMVETIDGLEQHILHRIKHNEPLEDLVELRNMTLNIWRIARASRRSRREGLKHIDGVWSEGTSFKMFHFVKRFLIRCMTLRSWF